MILLAFLLSWGIVATNTVVVVNGEAVCLRNEELQPRKQTEGVLWGWNEAATRKELDLGYSVRGVPEHLRPVCVEAIQRWGNEEYGIRIHMSEREPGTERTIVFVYEPLTGAELASAEFPWFGGPSSTIRVNSKADWEQFSILHVLMHEVGHALGFTHVEDKDSIMRPYHTGNERLGWSDIVRASQLYLTRPWPGSAALPR